MRNLGFYLFASFIIFLSFQVLSGQTQLIPLDTAHWDYRGATVNHGTFKGKDGAQVTGSIMLRDVEFANGTIEVDMNFTEERNFPGILFRAKGNHVENFYVRPHQSGNPDANQYTPDFNGTAGWQFYYGEEYSKAIEYEFDEWHHIKIELAGNQAQIYFEDMENPIIHIPALKTGSLSGLISLNGGRAPTWFANFKITPSNKTELGLEIIEPNIAEGTIKNWDISGVMADSIFRDKLEIEQEFINNVKWQRVETEPDGTLNLSKYIARSDGHNTAIAKLSINAAQDKIQKFNFGFSDFVTVYLNGKVLYSGGDNFMSRDYRFLGTVGYYDTLYLPLERGDNEVLLVVRENFGGWGVRGIFIP